MRVNYLLLLGLVGCLATSCGRYVLVKQSYEAKEISINAQLPKDTHIDSLIAPQKKLLDSLMNVVIATSEEELIKEKPSGTLNNFCADEMLHIAQQQNPAAEICIINYGGIRLSSLPKGAITVGKIYELLPFDNMIVIQKIDGKTLNEVLDYIASQGGWPISGLRFDIQNKKAVHIMVHNEPIDLHKMYTVVLSDYLANGGDNLAMLKKIPQEPTNLIMREAFIQAIKKSGSLPIDHEKRIQHVD